MEELVFASFEDAMNHLARLAGCQVLVAAKKKNKVKNPRKEPKSTGEKKNWNKKDMWGDPTNHKYPLFDDSTGKLSAKRAKSALRYLNMPRSKASYPSEKARARVMAKIIRAIFKAEPGANIKYQPKDKTYQALPAECSRYLSS